MAELGIEKASYEDYSPGLSLPSISARFLPVSATSSLYSVSSMYSDRSVASRSLQSVLGFA
jgi:hypothetical protein